MNWDENANLLKVGQEHNDEMRDTDINDIVRYLAYLESAAYIISYPFLASFVIVVARKRIFHLNLVVLLLNIAVSLFVSVVSRTTMLLIQLCSAQFIASAVYSWASKLSDVEVLFAEIALPSDGPVVVAVLGMCAMAFNLISLVIERVTASAMSRFYEKFCSRIPYLGFALCILEWTLCCILLCLYYTGHFSLLVLLAIILVFYIIALSVFCLLPVVASSGYKRGLHRLYAGDGHSLTERYQLSENLRCARMLNRVIVVISMTAFFAMASVGVSFLIPDIATTELLRRIYYLTPPVQTVLVTVVTLRASPKFRSELIHLFCCRQALVNGFFQPAGLSKTTVFRISVEEERRIYFENYNKAWS